MGLFGLRVKDSNPSNKVHSNLEVQFAHSDVSKTLTTDLSFSAYFLKFRFSNFQIWVQRSENLRIYVYVNFACHYHLNDFVNNFGFVVYE